MARNTHQAANHDIENGIWNGALHDLTILALHVAGGGGNGDALRADHLTASSTCCIGGYQPVGLTAFSTEERALSGHA